VKPPLPARPWGLPLAAGGRLADPLVLHADPWLLVIDKPSGLLSQGGRGPELADAVPARLEPHWGPLLLPHRLDRDTSGLLLLARDPATHRALSIALAARQVGRTYLADVAGTVAAAAGRLEAALAKARHQPPQYRVHPAGRPSCTDWWRLLQGEGWCRLRLEPRTGRSHQLRVHLAWWGHPILGDPLYGKARSRRGAQRLRLHAWRLSLVHPHTGEPLELEAPLPWRGGPEFLVG
jgi:tRNA pseudouridine32 synthase/23S rRNA pseudouridine746 synthase